jgi:hypothetical protein
MNSYIINVFILKNKNTLNEIYNYIKNRYHISIDIASVRGCISELMKNDIIFFHEKEYGLTDEGNVILNDTKYYYSKIIVRFLRGYRIRKKYVLREIRQEQQKLRKYLIDTKPHVCIICVKKLPLCLLETAHLKPRCILNYSEMNDINVVEFMCRYCHNLYDNGFLSVYNESLCVSDIINGYDINFTNKGIIYCNKNNEKYFNFHYRYIFRKNV